MKSDLSTAVIKYWCISEVSALVTGELRRSPAFFVDGYWFRLQVGRMMSPVGETVQNEAFGLFLELV